MPSLSFLRLLFAILSVLFFLLALIRLSLIDSFSIVGWIGSRCRRFVIVSINLVVGMECWFCRLFAFIPTGAVELSSHTKNSAITPIVD